MSVEALLHAKGTAVPTIHPDATITEAMDRLERDRVSALVVSDDSKGVVGILSASDVVRGLSHHGASVVDDVVADLMTPRPICCEIGAPMRQVYELMDRHQIRYLPVTENGALCGLVSLLDVVRYRLEEMETETEALKEYVAGRA